MLLNGCSFQNQFKNFWKVSIKELRRLDLRRGGTYTTVSRIFIGRELPRQLSAIRGDTNLLQLHKRLCFSGVL